MTKYTSEKIEALAAKLKNMPAVPKPSKELTKKEAIQALSREIIAMQKRGYTLDSIAEVLKSEGLTIAPRTLRSYMQNAKPAGRKRRASPSSNHRPAKSETPDTTNASLASFTPKPDTDDI